MAKQYGWTFDKAGNKVNVSAPTYANGKKARKSKTKTGGLLGGIGFGGVIGKR